MKNIFLYIYSLFLLFSNCQKIYSNDNTWVFSPHPERGRVLDISISNNNHIYLGTYNGLYKSTNSGISWFSLTKHDLSPDVLIHNNTLYYRRIRMNFSIGNYECDFLRSFDFGKTWDKISGKWDEDLEPYSITAWENKVYFCLKSKSKGTYHIYETEDNADNIIFVTSNMPYNESKTFGRLQVFGNNFIILGWDQQGHPVYFRSTNQGKDWLKIEYNGLQSTCNFFLSDSIFYIGTSDGIYGSTDMGQTWNYKWLKNNHIVNLYFLKQDKVILAVILQNNNYKFLISNNHGDNWSEITHFNDLNESGILFSILKEDSLGNFFGNPGYYGVYKSSDEGMSWSSSNVNLTSTSPSDFLFADSSIFMSCWGVFKSTDGGDTFDYLDLKQYDTGPIRRNSKGMLFVDDNGTGGTRQGIMRSDDGGRTWKSLYSNIRTDAFIINKRDVILTATLGNLQRSIDDGETWEYIVPPLAEALGTNDEGDFFVFSYDYPGGPEGQGIWRSTDDGETWDSIPCKTINSVNGRIIFNNYTKTAWFGPTFNETKNIWAIHKTTDNGRTWYVENLKEKGYDWYPSSSKVAVDSLGCWVAARDGEKYGIYRSCDNGTTWIREDTSGLPREFGPIGVSPDGYIYVFGATGGIYRSTKKYVSVYEEPKLTDNIIITPNPAVDYIEIENTNGSPIGAIKIYNVLGVCVLTDSNHPKTISERMNIKSLPAGVYFIHIDGQKMMKFVKL